MMPLKKQSEELMVTIRCITYNHERYIRQCLEGFIMQKANFRFEAIVHDDASTDGTANIIREYAEKYPDIIKPIFETENLYSKHDGSIARILNEHTHGKYVAMCEGDDYWIDPLKLQKQVDFLEQNLDYVFCCHRYKIYDENKMLFRKEYGYDYYEKNHNLSIDNALFLKVWVTQYCTSLFRRELYLKTYEELCHDGFNGRDVYLYYYLLKYGKGLSLNDSMAVYRWHNGGVAGCITLKQKRKVAYDIYIPLYRQHTSDNCLREKAINSLLKYMQQCNMPLKQKWRLLMEGFSLSKSFIEQIKLSTSFILPIGIFNWLYRFSEIKRNHKNLLVQ